LEIKKGSRQEEKDVRRGTTNLKRKGREEEEKGR
jgi:hypothetical protein